MRPGPRVCSEAARIEGDGYMRTLLVPGSGGHRHSFSRRGRRMSSTQFAAGWVARGFACVALTALLAIQQAGHLQAVATLPPNPLPDPHSYVVTGNYAVASDDIPAQTQKGTV